MKQLALVSTMTSVFAVIGFYLRTTIHGASAFTLIPAVAAALGGFGIGCASINVMRRLG